MPRLWHASPIVTFSAFALPKLSCLPLFSPLKILKGLLPGRCLPVRGVLSCPRETLFLLSRAKDSIGFYLSLAVTQNIKKRTLAQKKACLPSACPLLARCRLLACPRLSAPPRWFGTLWGREVRGERRWDGGANAIPTRRTRTPSSQAFLYLSQLPWKETEPHTLMKTGTAFCKY